MSVYYLLLAVNIIPCASIIPDSFPTRNLSAIYLLFLSACLILYYSHRVTQTGRLSPFMKSISWMEMLIILLRGIKYSVFAEVGALARHVWYLYYVPMLLLPLFLFCISLLVAPKKDFRIPKGWYPALALTVTFIVLVLTNDLHQLIFRFRPGFDNWDNDYSYGLLFYLLTAWQYGLYLAAITVLALKSRLVSSRKSAWIVAIPLAIGAALNILLVTGKMPRINGSNIIEFPEALFFTVAVLLECCMQLGLIPTNTDYGKLFREFSIAAQITDRKGNPVYSSRSAAPLTAEQFATPDGGRIGAHTVLHKMEIPGGFGFWQDDMTGIDRLNDELAEAKSKLSEEAELIRLKNELKEKETKTVQRTLVYDAIAKRTQKQSQAISKLAEAARKSDDLSLKEKYRNDILLLSAYIKRYANLTLLAEESSTVALGELVLSVSEVLRYLNFCGIPGELVSNADCTVDGGAALAVFEAFEILLESNKPYLRGVFVNISADENATLKLTLENPKTPLAAETKYALSRAGVNTESSNEDNLAYICFTLKKGGGAV